MRKNTIKLILTLIGATSILFTSCIEETYQTNVATEDDLAVSIKAKEALMWGLPAFANKYNFLDNSQAYDWGYGSLMHIRDVMGDDMTIASSGYDWYSNWQANTSIGPSLMRTQFHWTYLYKYVLSSNKMIAAIDVNNADDVQLGYLGIGYAYRAFVYLDIARMYEFLENDATDYINAAGNNILNLTAPIVTETTTEEEARTNPRVTREEMFEFILSDLKLAEEYIVKLARPSKTVPDLAVVYGLMARLYMWVEDYPNAKTFARKAINESAARPTTEAEWLSTTSGFNDIATPSWMWGSSMAKEDDVVASKLLNWTSWMSNETHYGYISYGPYVMIDASTYQRIDDTDFRKLSWKAPKDSPLSDKITYTDKEIGAGLPTYASLKFRPGAGNSKTPTVGSACAYPLMRIEEMYFIEAEATAQSDPSAGLQLLNKFMLDYRNKEYKYEGTQDKVGIIDEIIFQKRIELWGEGLNYFDYKRLNIPVQRGYKGTNVSAAKRFNTTTRPAWMNFCIVRSEPSNNPALEGYENPDPSGLYKPWTE